MSQVEQQFPPLEEYDLVILGDGTGSTLAAWTFAAEGQRVAVIERRYIGGSCPNIACLPSKNIIQAPRSRLTFEEVKSSAFPRRNSPSTCTLFANANAAWSRGGMLCIWTITKSAERNSSWAPGASLALELWRSHSQREQRVNCEEGTLSSAQVRAQRSTRLLAL